PRGAAPPPDCADVLVHEHRINVGSGVYTEQAVAAAPLEIAIPIALDGERYGGCLEREGRDDSAAVTAWVERSAACRRDRAPQVRIGAPGSAPRIAGGADDERYRACLDGAPEVEVELPE
ncbi:MAG: hypothetical protein WD928_15105, partial [Gammaproteobacteria bacterium]